MSNKFDFNQLFILDLANNHQGDLKHGIRVIQEAGAVVKKYGIRAALKFQFREINSFIHPEFKGRKDIKHIARFTETSLQREDYVTLMEEVKKQGMVTMSTPFDEASVDLLVDLDLDVIKVASCSALDRPLLEKVATANKPVVISTAGLSISQIDRLVSFFQHSYVDFAIMHCVAIYPTPDEKLRLNQIDTLRSRYPDIPIGFSTHEDPNKLSAIQVAYAKGAQLFERHIGLNTDVHKLNNYSSTPEQLDKWFAAYKDAVVCCGGEGRAPAFPEEIESLRSLMRGVYLKCTMTEGKPLRREDVFFAMPLHEGQLSSGDWRQGLVADRNYNSNDPISLNVVAKSETPREELIYQILLQVKGMLNNARVVIGKESSVEISHHYGIERFREFGAVIVHCVNRSYCKKLVIQLPRQKHPYHFHKQKEETFQLLYGDLEVEIDGFKRKLMPGDTLLVESQKWHKFHTLDGAIFEEVSTTDIPGDSVYEDERIARLSREQRKTRIPNWEAGIEPVFSKI